MAVRREGHGEMADGVKTYGMIRIMSTTVVESVNSSVQGSL